MTPRVGTDRRAFVIRAVTDQALLILGLWAGAATRIFLIEALSGSPLGPYQVRHELAAAMERIPLSAAILLPLGFLVFYANGFYTRNRFYASRYKAIAIVGGVSLLYLLFAATPYVGLLASPPPRAEFVFSWLATLVLVGGARFWIFAWRRIVEPTGDRRRTHTGEHGGRVLVVGGAGYIGSALVGELLAHGFRVRVLDLLVYGDEPLRPHLANPNLELIKGDFRHVDELVTACRGAATVIHLGGIVGDPACAIDEGLTIDVNLSATRMVAQVAKGMGVRRLIFASTCSVYGASDGVLDEKSRLNPVSLYARTKLASERVLLEIQDEEMSVVILRFSTIFGFSGRVRFDLVVNLLTAQAVCNSEITVKGGDQWRPFVHVQDAALSVVAALRADDSTIRGQIFNVGGDENNFTIRDVGTLVKELVPSANLLDLPADGDRRNYRVSFAKIHRELDFTPRWTLRSGILQVIERLGDGSIPDWRHPKFSNYASLKSGVVQLPRPDLSWEAEYLADIDTAGAPPGVSTSQPS
jgi:nucleoside-diphosphate-sugar epimerase